MSTSTKNGAPRSRVFLCILYPDCREHMQMSHYLEAMSSIFEWCRILHDKDQKDADQPGLYIPNSAQGLKKAHYHYMIRYKEAKTVTSVEKYFSPYNVHFEICHDVQSSLLYFCHMTPEAMAQGKEPYPPEKLEGSARLISQMGLNSNLFQLAEALKLLRDCDGNVTDMITLLAEQNPVYGENVLKTIQSYQGIYVCASRQEYQDAHSRSGL